MNLWVEFLFNTIIFIKIVKSSGIIKVTLDPLLFSEKLFYTMKV